MSDEACPFAFNFDPATFKAGDTVSYRITGSLSGMPFAGTLIEVHDNYVVLADAGDPGLPMRGTRETRPLVEEAEIARANDVAIQAREAGDGSPDGAASA